MDLVVSYFGSDIDGRGSKITFLIEEGSADIAKSRFVHALKQAVTERRTKFCFWGRYHHVHNFISTMSQERFEYLNQQAKSRGLTFPKAINPSEFDKEVTIVQMVPSVRTVNECLMAAKMKQRALRWMQEGTDYVYFLDELWDRDIVLPATRVDVGMQVTPCEGKAVALQPDWDYYIEGHQDEVVIRAKGHELVVHESETGYSVKSAK